MSLRSRPILPLLAAACGALCMCWSSTSHSAEQRIVCPTSLEPGSVQGNAPAGWRIVMPQAAQLMGAGMLHGPPEESGYLVPDQNKGVTQGNRRIWTQRWEFDQPHWYPTFAYCAYDGGAIQLFRPIPKEAKECSLAGRKKGGVVEEATFVCK